MSEVNATLRLQVKEEVTAAMNKARGEIDKLQQSSDRTKNVVKDLFKELAGPVAGLGTVAGIAQFIRSSVEAADAMQAMERRAQAVYGDAFPKVRHEAEGLASVLHRSQSDILGYMTDFGALFDRMHLSQG